MTKKHSNRINEHSKESEKILQQIVAKSLLNDFVHLCPFFRPRKTKIEFCDLLIEDDEQAAVVQLKVQNTEEARPDRDESAWAINRCKDGFIQTKKKLPITEELSIYSKNTVRGTVCFNPKQLAFKHILVVVEYNKNEIAVEDIPNSIEGYGAVHYLTIWDFIFVCQELLTVSDLFDYLDFRAKLPIKARPLLSGERDFYAFYIMHGRFKELPATTSDFAGSWIELSVTNQEQYKEKKREDLDARAFSEMILHNLQFDIVYEDDWNEETKILAYAEAEKTRFEIVRHLSKFRRIPLRRLFAALRNCAIKADSSDLPFFAQAIRPEKSGALCICAASRSSYSDRIEEITFLAQGLISIIDVEYVIGIITSNMRAIQMNEAPFSFKIIMFDRTERLEDSKDIELIKQLFPEQVYIKTHDFPKPLN